jgi:hypothetical protein
MQLLIGILIIVGLIAIIFFLAHLQGITTYFVEKFNTPYTENMTNCAGVDCSECNEDFFEVLDLDTIETYYETDEEEEDWGEEGFKTYIDILEFERIIEGDIKVGDCFIEIEGFFEGTVWIIMEVSENGDLSYEYVPSTENGCEPWFVSGSKSSITKEEISEEVQKGRMQYLGTFDLGEDNE